MFLYDVINHASSVLPLFTNAFTNNISIAAISKTVDTVTVTADNHGLALGDKVILSNIKTKIVINSLTFDGLIGTAVCDSDHDLTEKFIKKVEIINSADDKYNGYFELLDVIDFTTFTFTLLETPAGSSSANLLTFHNIGFNGPVVVTNIVDVNNFDYELETGSPLIAGGSDNMLLGKAPKITGAATLDRAIDSYTKQNINDLFGFFVKDDTQTSDDWYIKNDSKNERQHFEDVKLRLIYNFSLYIFIPTKNSVSGRKAVDDAEALTRPILKTMTGFIPKNTFTTDQQTIVMPAGAGVVNYAVPFLIYEFKFQVTEFMLSEGEGEEGEFMENSGDTLPNFRTVAFKTFEWREKNEYNEIVKDNTFEV